MEKADIHIFPCHYYRLVFYSHLPAKNYAITQRGEACERTIK